MGLSQCWLLEVHVVVKQHKPDIEASTIPEEVGPWHTAKGCVTRVGVKTFIKNLFWKRVYRSISILEQLNVFMTPISNIGSDQKTCCGRPGAAFKASDQFSLNHSLHVLQSSTSHLPEDTRELINECALHYHDELVSSNAIIHTKHHAQCKLI